ncbi:alpha amylase C-terminal domain-containing protein, partial [Nocardiopsis chromatogenes]|uniref:alpha amylase C-terminal domain-containing protein n=1 Tax=Nocardiopsis chromatogenes TaxID=280239 RepID=UPI00059546CE
PHAGRRVGLPEPGPWRVLLDTDDAGFGGSGFRGGPALVEAASEPAHGLPASAVLDLPPLGVLWLEPDTPAHGGEPRGGGR